ncbi:NCAIR mutase [Cenarchaeum symbiosum A]|uniref:NCAIR mutase n=1 Tax=Cenarchaeum symbiosum (strain A) TaxID=414004 RepID=A0RXX9_CENSY|nr:NCAIR mutase [Cenarchaeum symbiosum A]
MELDEILESLAAGRMDSAEARRLLSLYSIEKMGEFAKFDAGRKNRRGIPEVVYAGGKQPVEIREIITGALNSSDSVLVSRIRADDLPDIMKFAGEAGLRTDEGRNSSSVLFFRNPPPEYPGKVGIICAGTSDIGIAEEARLMCRAMNCGSICSYDVGVAGMHRLFPVLKEMVAGDVDVIVAVAGMEGALATIVSSMVDLPVIGVPSSAGYGYGGDGIGALAAMLQSCTLGVSVVNIDNGIGAGAVAASICRRVRLRGGAEPSADPRP